MVEEVKLPTYETLLTEAIRSLAVDSGVVSSRVNPGGNALNDATKNWATGVHKNRLVKIVRGSGTGQLAIIDNNSPDSLLIKGTWAKGIDTTSVYVILEKDLAQILRNVFGGGSDISAANPLETHDPKVEAVEDKLDDPNHGLAALAAAIAGVAGGAFYGSYGPRNVEVDNDVDFGQILYDPAGNIITTGEITPGTYTVRRVRAAVDTQIVAPAASSEAAGRVYMTYNFPVANWAVGDIFYITFSGITVTLEGITTEYPDLYIWGRVVREAGIAADVTSLLADLGDASASTLGSVYAILGNPAQTFLAMLGYEGATALADKLTAVRATLLDQITAARMAELDAANLPATTDGIKTQTDKLAGQTPSSGSVNANWQSGTGTSGETGADLVSIGANDTKYKLHSLLLNISALTAAANITVKLFMQVNGTERKVYSQTFVKGTDPDGLWIVNGTVGIHEVLRVEVQSDQAGDNGSAVEYDYMLEAM